MDVKLTPCRLAGTITPPPSKSQAHRYLIAAALAQGESTLQNVALSQDIEATLRCMRALGAQCAADGRCIVGCTPHPDQGALPLLDCGESGSTLRFVIPIALAVAAGGRFVGRGRLMSRPQQPYETLFAEKGITFRRDADGILAQGTLRAGRYRLAGNVSSQFITGLLYALPLLEGDSEIELTTPLESAGYIDMTLDALHTFGVGVARTSTGWHIPGAKAYRAQQVAVESDYSQAGFFFAANALGNALSIRGLREDSVQGDRVIVSQCRALAQAGEVTLDVRECPDLVPPLALIAALRCGEVTRLVGAARLRMKESDRLDTVSRQLNALGANVEQGADYLNIYGVERLHGGTVDACNDHRIAMMLAMAATRATESVTITDAGSVAKSYPDFWADYAALGGKVERLG